MVVRDYEVVIRHLSDDDGGGYLATVPELPGCMTDGETRAEALEHVEDAMLAWAFAANEMGRKIPRLDAHTLSAGPGVPDF
jgi:predicted RNase H-like HicB family nuclease